MASKQERSSFGRIYKRTGRPGYYLRVRLDGREVNRYAGPDKRTATEYQAQLMQRVARQELLGEVSVPAVTFGKFQTTLLGHFKAHHAPSTVESEMGRLNRVVEWFGEVPLRDIDAGMVQEFFTWLRNEAGCSHATVNRYASLISVAFRVAIGQGLARQNPVRDVVRSREPVRPVPYVSSEDVARLVATASDPRYGALLRVLADTGIRRSESLALQWRDVHLERRRIVVRQSKNGKPRDVDLTAEAARVLGELHRERPAGGENQHVWPEWQGKLAQAVSSRFKTVTRRAGLPGLRLHDLRHGFCSRLAQAGVPLPTISVLAGHTSWATTQRYASHLPGGATRAAIERMERSEGSIDADDERRP